MDAPRLISPSNDNGTGLRLRRWFFIALGVLVGLNLFIHPHHPHFALEKFPGFWAVFGLVAALVLGKVAKGSAHTFLGKPEDFYESKDNAKGESR